MNRWRVAQCCSWPLERHDTTIGRSSRTTTTICADAWFAPVCSRPTPGHTVEVQAFLCGNDFCFSLASISVHLTTHAVCCLIGLYRATHWGGGQCNSMHVPRGRVSIMISSLDSQSGCTGFDRGITLCARGSTSMLTFRRRQIGQHVSAFVNIFSVFKSKISCIKTLACYRYYRCYSMRICTWKLSNIQCTRIQLALRVFFIISALSLATSCLLFYQYYLSILLFNNVLDYAMFFVVCFVCATS